MYTRSSFIQSVDLLNVALEITRQQQGIRFYLLPGMEKNINQQIIEEMTQLLEKMAVESFVPDTASGAEGAQAFLITLKGMNARYDKQEALAQVQALLRKYNIQVDELLEQIRY